MAKIGYARVSSKEQHLDRQLAALKGVDKLFSDKLSGANTKRPELQKMLAYIREGDIVMVTELDRLGRNNQDLPHFSSVCLRTAFINNSWLIVSKNLLMSISKIGRASCRERV